MPVDYSELKQAVADWLMRPDLESVIPTFIMFAEAEFNRRLRTREMLHREGLTFQDGKAELPPDYRDHKSVLIEDADAPLEYFPVDSLHLLTQTGDPRYYTIIEERMVQAHPKPDGTLSGEILYYADIRPLSDTPGRGTNWLLKKHPDAYLYTTLIQSAPYLKEDERLDTWNALSLHVLEGIAAGDERAKHTEGTLKIRARSLG
jgi:hypothetical protein